MSSSDDATEIHPIRVCVRARVCVLFSVLTVPRIFPYHIVPEKLGPDGYFR